MTPCQETTVLFCSSPVSSQTHVTTENFKTPPRTTDANLDCVDVKKRTFFVVLKLWGLGPP